MSPSHIDVSNYELENGVGSLISFVIKCKSI
jgi:hypothetical protein